jgi:glycosyltransferase involved in cell wall biosynthesis
MNQTYPHAKLFILVVDGNSNDKTVETAMQTLAKSDINFEVLVQKCNIPEGRNICVKHMQGEYLLFWDSDVIMEPTAISAFMETIRKDQADVVTAGEAVSLSFSSLDDMNSNLPERMKATRFKDTTSKIATVGLGYTIISKKIFDGFRFDEELPTWEDGDFSLYARNFRVFSNNKIGAFDINVARVKHSNVYVDMPLHEAMRGIRKASRTEVTVSQYLLHQSLRKYISINKRYVFYAGYLPLIVLTIAGFFLRNLLLTSFFPIYVLLFALLQFKRKGIVQGAKSVVRSLAIGVPTSLFVMYYFAKFALTKRAEEKWYP